MTFDVGTRVRFREGTPQYAKNKDIVYLIERDPHGLVAPSVDQVGRRYYWLVNEDDMDRPPSRRRRRSGWEDALEAALNYRHTHVSRFDDSPAMLVSQTDETITLVNEDGFEWTDPIDQWVPITPADDAPVEP